MNEFSPYINILIPVKDRAEYLFHTLRTIEIQKYRNLRVIVSDDGSSDHTREVVENARKRDSRISYVSPGEQGGMRRNFEFALNHVEKGYVLFLGGDDGLMPSSIERMVQRINETKVDLITWNPPIYTYPGTKSRYGNIKISKTGLSRFVNSNEYLLRQSKVLNYIADEETPMIYVKGAASVELINRVRQRSENHEFYQSPTPDGYSGIVLAGEVQKFWFEEKPISIYGVSPSSQGMAYLSAEERAKQQSMSFFEQAANHHMADELANQPYSPLITLMTADYLLTASKLPNWPGKLGEIDYSKLILKAINELSNGLYATDRINRELNILHNIARHHKLDTYMKQVLEKKWKYIQRPDFDADGGNLHSLFLDCQGSFINNIFDAAYFIQSISLIRKKVSISNIFNATISSLKYKISGSRRIAKMSNYRSNEE